MTAKEQDAVRPSASRAVAVTEVDPSGNLVPDSWLYVTDTGARPPEAEASE